MTSSFKRLRVLSLMIVKKYADCPEKKIIMEELMNDLKSDVEPNCKFCGKKPDGAIFFIYNPLSNGFEFIESIFENKLVITEDQYRVNVSVGYFERSYKKKDLCSKFLFDLLRRRCFRKKMIYRLKFIRVLKELKEHFKYRPGGVGWMEARDHFNKIK